MPASPKPNRRRSGFRSILRHTISPPKIAAGAAPAKNMSRSSLFDGLADRHAARVRASLVRRLRTVDAVDGAHIRIDGKRLLDFASNDYLGLAQHAALREALVRATAKWGVGATAAPLLGGRRDEHAALEESLARWTGRERALLFSDGWMANLGTVSALLGRGDLCVEDKLDHASLLDAARLSGAELRRYPHAAVDAARRRLESHRNAAALVASDGVFSMDGDVAPLTALAKLCRDEHATLMIDDAHGLGVLGPEGAGSVAEARLTQDDVPILMATLGKALGTAGAFVAGSATLIDALVQEARTFVYTTAMPPAIAAAARAAIDVARFEGWRRDRLARLVDHLRAGMIAQGWTLTDSRTPIQPIVIGASDAALAAAAMLEDAGFHVPAVRPPTVPSGSARLRVTLSALHGESDVDRLLDALRTIRPRMPKHGG
jgi:8-amino-7-oxononanoate synthase